MTGRTASGAPLPPPCDDEVFKKGKSIVALDAASEHAEEWVQAVAKSSGQRVDWHYSGGIANVLFLGDRAKVMAAIEAMPKPGRMKKGYDGKPTPAVRIMRVYGDEETGLYRQGVTPAPEGAIAGFMDIDGSTSFIVKDK
jgi:hypothetical protein